jgi:replicative DNA helicase
MDHMALLTERIQAGQTPLIPTGIPSLDRASGGIGQDEFWLVTGPTKSGKSVLTGCIGVNASQKGFKTKIYTNEVGRRTYAGRILASAAEGIDGTIERKGLTTRAQQSAYANAQNCLMKSIGKMMIIDNASGKYVEDLVADMRQESESGVKLFIVDLIGKIRTRQNFASRERELSHISLSLYEATKRYKCACIVVAQENEDGQVRESRSLAMDCEAWIKVCHVFNQPEKKRFSGTSEPEIVRDRRDILVELARGFAAGDKIRCLFDGGRFLIRELSSDNWTEE